MFKLPELLSPQKGRGVYEENRPEATRGPFRALQRLVAVGEVAWALLLLGVKAEKGRVLAA